jgi:predicted DNA-binding protein (UPF0251 family)
MPKTLPSAPKRTRAVRLRPALATAVRLMVHEALTVTDAANRVGMQRDSLARALLRPHVIAAKAAVKRAWLGSETAKAWLTMADLANHAASEDVRHKAAKVILDAAGELDGSASSERRPERPTVVINLQHPADVAAVGGHHSGVIERASSFQVIESARVGEQVR